MEAEVVLPSDVDYEPAVFPPHVLPVVERSVVQQPLGLVAVRQSLTPVIIVGLELAGPFALVLARAIAF